jgi:hypothetical protein
MHDVTKIVVSAMQALARERPIFHSEADFQLALAWMFQRLHPDAQLRLERRMLDDPRIELDIFIRLAGRRYGLELKYPRLRADVDVGGERFALRTGAPDVERHDVVKDVSRLERLIKTDMIDAGVALVLTNAAGFWQSVTGERVTSYDAFRIHHGHRLEGVAEWGPTAGIGTRAAREEPIVLAGSYERRDYADVGEIALRYLLIAVSEGISI